MMNRLSPEAGRRVRHGKPFQPAVGTDFGRISDMEAQTRDFLARFIAFTAAVALAITGAYGLAVRNFGPIMAVWAIAGPLFGAVVTHYFGLGRTLSR